MVSSETLPATQGSPTYGFMWFLMMEKRAGTCWTVPCESTTLALLISQSPYSRHRGLHLVAKEWFLGGFADFYTLKFNSICSKRPHWKLIVTNISVCFQCFLYYLYSMSYFILTPSIFLYISSWLPAFPKLPLDNCQRMSVCSQLNDQYYNVSRVWILTV